MENIEKIYSNLKEIEQTLTNAIIFHEKNYKKGGRFFKSFHEVSEKLEKINALKNIRFSVRMLIQSTEEIINDYQNKGGLKND